MEPKRHHSTEIVFACSDGERVACPLSAAKNATSFATGSTHAIGIVVDALEGGEESDAESLSVPIHSSMMKRVVAFAVAHEFDPVEPLPKPFPYPAPKPLFRSEFDQTFFGDLKPAEMFELAKVANFLRYDPLLWNTLGYIASFCVSDDSKETVAERLGVRLKTEEEYKKFVTANPWLFEI